MARIKGYQDVELAKAKAKQDWINTGKPHKVVKRAGFYFVEKDKTSEQKVKDVKGKIGSVAEPAISDIKYIAKTKVRSGSYRQSAQSKTSPFISKSGRHIAQNPNSRELVTTRTATHPAIRINPDLSSMRNSSFGVANRGFADIPRM